MVPRIMESDLHLFAENMMGGITKTLDEIEVVSLQEATTKE